MEPSVFRQRVGCDPRTYCHKLVEERPSWVTGSLSHSDTRFLFDAALNSGSSLAVEIGTASGFSTAVLCKALSIAAGAGYVSEDFRVLSYDISPTFYGDQSKQVGDAAREQLAPGLLNHIEFRHPFTATALKEFHEPNELRFLFIDANHKHPWPALDLLAALDCLDRGATVVLHDINLPLLHPEFANWGVKYLFDDLRVEKRTADGEQTPNIGSITIPEDKEELRIQILEIIFSHPSETKVPEPYLKGLGVEQMLGME
jgi:predicted O-methyltransferase YrrM